LPSDAQDEIARICFSSPAARTPVGAVVPGERAAIAVSKAAAARGEFATDEEVKSVWAKHGL